MNEWTELERSIIGKMLEREKLMLALLHNEPHEITMRNELIKNSSLPTHNLRSGEILSITFAIRAVTKKRRKTNHFNESELMVMKLARLVKVRKEANHRVKKLTKEIEKMKQQRGWLW